MYGVIPQLENELMNQEKVTDSFLKKKLLKMILQILFQSGQEFQLII